jgi:hypothetical protein
MLKMSVKEKHTTSLTPFNWKDCDAPELRNHGFILPEEATDFSPLQGVQIGSWGPTTLLINGYWGSWGKNLPLTSDRY